MNVDNSNDKHDDGTEVESVRVFNMNTMKNLVDARRMVDDIEGFSGASLLGANRTSNVNGYLTMRISADSFTFNEDDCKLLSEMISKVDFLSASLLVSTDVIALDFSVKNTAEEIKNG